MANKIFLSEPLQKVVAPCINFQSEANEVLQKEMVQSIGKMPPTVMNEIYSRYAGLFEKNVKEPNKAGLELFIKNPNHVVMNQVVREVINDIGIANQYALIFSKKACTFSDSKSLFNGFSSSAKNAIQNQLNILDALAKSSRKEQAKSALSIEQANTDQFKSAITMAFQDMDTLEELSSSSSSSSSTLLKQKKDSVSTPTLPGLPPRAGLSGSQSLTNLTSLASNSLAPSKMNQSQIPLTDAKPSLPQLTSLTNLAPIPTLASTKSGSKAKNETEAEVPTGTYNVFNSELLTTLQNLKPGQTIVAAPKTGTVILPIANTQAQSLTPPQSPKITEQDLEKSSEAEGEDDDEDIDTAETGEGSDSGEVGDDYDTQEEDGINNTEGTDEPENTTETDANGLFIDDNIDEDTPQQPPLADSLTQTQQPPAPSLKEKLNKAKAAIQNSNAPASVAPGVSATTTNTTTIIIGTPGTNTITTDASTESKSGSEDNSTR